MGTNLRTGDEDASPTGAAGGALSGTYPDPGFFTTGRVDGDVLIANAAAPDEGVEWGLPPGGPPSGAAGGVLGGNYPNPGFAADMATQAELDAVAAAAMQDGEAAAGVLSGTYPNPGFAADMATQAELDAAIATRLAATAAAGGVLSGNYPNPGFAAGVPLEYILIVEQQAANTQGGTFTTGAWRTRTLNTEKADTGGNATLAANQITLDAGTYRCRIECPALGVDAHKARLYNTTAGATVLVGTSEFSASAAAYAQTMSVIEGRFAIAAGQALEVQHSCGATRAANGFGIQSNLTEVEIFTIVELIKET